MSIEPAVFASVFGIVFVAELPDKTALASLVLATRYRPLAVFLGAAAALAIQSFVAVAAGQLVSLLPARPVHVVAGLLFLLSSVLMWRRKSDGETRGGDDGGQGLACQTGRVFAVVFIAEWGDLTQLATAALAARYHAPITVFAAATLALWAVVAIMILLGSGAGRLFRPEVTRKVAAVAFAGVGVALIMGVF